MMSPVKNGGCKKLLPGNSVKKVPSWKNKPIFTKLILLFITNAFVHMEFSLGIKLTMCDNQANNGHQ